MPANTTRPVGPHPATARPAPREHLRFTSGRTTAGAVAIAADDAGLVALELAATPRAARELLAQRFPHARLRDDDEGLHEWLELARGAIDDGSDDVPPLAPRGTEFQQRVWRELRAIPRGTTLAYGELAARLGRPRAMRAVAAACRANPLAVLVPCHRVVGRDGSLTGFRWGLERKRVLLERERA